jgi:hypothetical protein
LISTNLIWSETFTELVSRWWALQPAEVREAAGGIAEAALRAERRAATIMKFAALRPAERRIKTQREWEVRWDPRAAWDRLARVCDHQGWKPKRHRGGSADFAVAEGAGLETDRPTILIADAALAGQAALAKSHGLLIRLDVDDLAPVALARELYHVCVDKVGAEAAPWVEELAPHHFTQEVLGLPFNPLVFALLPPPGGDKATNRTEKA